MVASQAHKMADIVTEQWIQIQWLELALHITQRNRDRGVHITVLVITFGYYVPTGTMNIGAIGCSYVFVGTKGSSWLAEFKGIWFQSSDHLVDATLPATEVKSSELSIRNDSEERDVVNIFASLSLKPSNLPARDAPWNWSWMLYTEGWSIEVLDTSIRDSGDPHEVRNSGDRLSMSITVKGISMNSKSYEMAISTLKTILNLYVVLWIVVKTSVCFESYLEAQHNPRDSPSMSFTVLMLSGEGSLPQAQKPCSYSERDLNEFEVGPSFKAFSTKEGRCFRFGAKTHEVPKLCEEGSPKMPLQCARVIGYAITKSMCFVSFLTIV
ncbi:unnamed protein product [Prunus armeniaca]